MTYTVFVYQAGQVRSRKAFASQHEANDYIRTLDNDQSAERVVLDDGQKILADVTRNSSGHLATTAKP
jgi:hypothetical protein